MVLAAFWLLRPVFDGGLIQESIPREMAVFLLGFGGSFLFAENLEEGRLMVVGGRGFLPIESIGTLPPVGASIRRLPVCRGNRQIFRNYCLFWNKEHSNYYIEEFAGLLKKLILRE